MIFSLFSELGYSPEEFKRIHLQINSTTSDKNEPNGTKAMKFETARIRVFIRRFRSRSLPILANIYGRELPFFINISSQGSEFRSPCLRELLKIIILINQHAQIRTSQPLVNKYLLLMIALIQGLNQYSVAFFETKLIHLIARCNI